MALYNQRLNTEKSVSNMLLLHNQLQILHGTQTSPDAAFGNKLQKFLGSGVDLESDIYGDLCQNVPWP